MFPKHKWIDVVAFEVMPQRVALLAFGILPQGLMGLCAIALVNSQFY